MAANHRPRNVWRAPLLIGPLLLGLSGCVAVPLVGAMASGAGNAGMLSAMQSFLPGQGASHAVPCATGATGLTGTTSLTGSGVSGASGCAAAGAQAAGPADDVAQAPGGAPTDPTGSSDAGQRVTSAGGGGGVFGSMLQGFAGGIQNVVRGTGLSN